MNDEQARAAVGRWRSIWTLSVLGLAPALYLLPRMVCGESWVSPAVWCAAVGSALLLFWPRRRAWVGLNHLRTYPPVWVSAAIGLLIIFALLSFGVPLFSKECADLQFAERYPLAGIGLLGGLVLIAWATAWTRTVDRASTQSSALSLGEWLARDEPISTRVDDRFGIAAVVDQLREALQVRQGSVALLGAMGSGKSSVREILSRELETTTRIVRVSLWPFDNTSTAIAGLLRELSKELSKEVASAGFSNVANDYLEIIEDAPGPWKKLLQIAQPADPEAELARLDSTATAIGVQLVLWIEDIERFSESTETDAPDYARLAPLRALIAQLNARQSIRVVLATSALHARDDLERLVRHVVMIPTIPIAALEATARQVRETFAQGFRSDALTECDRIIAALCSTPRRIKFGLREFQRAWARVSGEVDLHDTYLLSVARHACPQLIDVINRHIHFLRNGVVGRSGDPRAVDAVRGRVESDLTQAISGLDEQGREAAREIVDRVFAGWARGAGADRGNAFQSVSQSDGDYWSRLVTFALPEIIDRDQYVQHLIQDSRTDEVADLLRKSHPATLRLLRHVQANVLAAVFARLLELGGLKAGAGQYQVESLVSVWRILLQRNDKARGACLDVVCNWARQASELELSTIGTLAYFWLGNDNRLFQQPVADAARDLLRRELVRRYAKRPQAIADGLRGLAPSTLRLALFVFPLQRVSTADPDWSQISAAIVQALQLDLVTMPPQIAPLLVDSRERMSFDEEPTFLTEFSVDDVQVTRLFGDSLDEVVLPKTDSAQVEALRRALEQRRDQASTGAAQESPRPEPR